MKNDLIITRFKNEPIIGTKSYYEPRTFFGSKMINVENTIIIDEKTIQYSEINDNTNNNGYQYYNDIYENDKIYLIDLIDIKNNNHTIVLSPQSDMDKITNTNWTINIQWRNILKEYLFYKIKEKRVFKGIKYNDVLGNNINLYIKNYIDKNILNRYELNTIDFYVEYKTLDDGDFNKKSNLQYNPKFDVNIKNQDNLIKNANSIIFENNVELNYKQTKTSKLYKFDYYFVLNFIRI